MIVWFTVSIVNIGYKNYQNKLIIQYKVHIV